MLTKVLIVLTTGLLAATTVEAKTCRPEDAEYSLKYHMIEILSGAPILVIGKDIGHDRELNRVYFQVDCILKSAVDIPINITLKDADIPDSCSATFLNSGKAYVLCLQKTTDVDLSTSEYSIYQRGDFNPGAWEITDDVENTAINLCGVTPKEMGNGPNMCPERTVSDTTCLDVKDISVGSKLRVDMLLSFLMLILLHYIMP